MYSLQLLYTAQCTCTVCVMAQCPFI